MAIKKEIEKENGIVLSYHRIVALNKITNIANTIEVNSYISMTQREKEKRYQELQRKKFNNEELTNEEREEINNGINIIVEADYIDLGYDENMTIEQAYKYLKGIEKYKDSEDI